MKQILGHVHQHLTRGLIILMSVVMLALTGPASLVQADTAPPSGTPATVSADLLPTVQVTGIVWAQAIVGDTVYATGSFTKVRPAGSVAGGADEVNRSNLLAYDITTGNLLPFNHSLNGAGRAIAVSPDSKRLYVGGDFATVDGAAHSRLAAFDLATGELMAGFTGGTSGSVRSLAATNTTIYVGGGFGSAGGQPRSSLAAFTTTGTLLDWKPAADLTVAAMIMSPDASKVIVGGSFSKINDTPYHALAAIDPVSGVPLPWASQSDAFPIHNDGLKSGITSLSANANTIFLTGFNYDSLGKVGGFEGRAAISPVDGHLIWLNDCHGDSYSAYPIGNVLYSVGHAHNCKPAGFYPETSPRTWHRALAETIYPTHVNTTKGAGVYETFENNPAATLLNWFPTVNTGTYSGVNQGGWSIIGNSNYISMGGEFTLINGKPQQGLARFAISSKAPNKLGPIAYGSPAVTAGKANKNGKVMVSWKTTWDQDNTTLKYKLYRDGHKVSVQTKSSTFWQLPTMQFKDNGLKPGSKHTYRLVVSDPFGNKISTTSK